MGVNKRTKQASCFNVNIRVPVPAAPRPEGEAARPQPPAWHHIASSENRGLCYLAYDVATCWLAVHGLCGKSVEEVGCASLQVKKA